MSDDYHDDDSRSGGLWDPDAYAPPSPTQERPTLRVIESHDEGPVLSSSDLVAGSGDALVRLDQFRPVQPIEPSSHRQLPHRRAAALAAAGVVIAAITVTIIEMSAGGARHAPPAVASPLATDQEQAALVRHVEPRPTATKHRHVSHQAKPHTSHRARQDATAPAPTHRSIPSPLAQQLSKSTAPSKPKATVHQYDVVSSDTTTPELTQPVAASSEFGFEGK
jgi:hypothetical protein